MIGKDERETEKLAPVVTMIVREWENLAFWLGVQNVYCVCGDRDEDKFDKRLGGTLTLEKSRDAHNTRDNSLGKSATKQHEILRPLRRQIFLISESNVY